MIDKKTFKKSVALPLEQAGFIKKGQSWYLDGKDALIVFNMEKIDMFSNEQYVFNVGIWLKAFGIPLFPTYNNCHLYYRVERLLPEFRELILNGGALERSNTQLLSEFVSFISSTLIPFLYGCTNEDNLRGMMSDNRLNMGFVRIEAREYLTRQVPHK